MNYVFVVWGLAEAPALWLAAMRSGVGALGGLAFVFATRRIRFLDGRGRRDALLLGLPNTALFFGLWFIAGASVPPGQAAVFVYTFPLWVALLSAAFFRYSLTGLQVVAILVGFAGVLLVSQPWNHSQGFALLPVTLLLVAAFAWAVGTVLFKHRFHGEAVHAANAFQLLGGTAGLLLASWVTEPGGFVPSLRLLGIVLWLGLAGTALSYMIWFWLLDRLHATTLSAYVFLVPLVALVASLLLLGEGLGPGQVAGVGFVLSSIYLMARASQAGQGPGGTPATEGTTPPRGVPAAAPFKGG
jgi:probable blue pigment (indigoidine) exporter